VKERNTLIDAKALEAEQKRMYAESVQRTNRFIISTLSILLILVAIVERELLDAKSQARKVRREVIKVTERLHRGTESLAYGFSELKDLINSPSSPMDLVAELELDKIPELSGFAAITADKLKQIEDLQARVTVRLGEETKQGKTQRDTRLIVFLEKVARRIKPYKKAYQDCLSLKQSALSKRTELQTMRSAKQAIPTPFGNFQVPPKLALLALAFAAVLTYLIFMTSVIRLRALTRDYLVLEEEQKKSPLDHFPPFWLYGRDRSNFSLLFSSPNLSKSSLIAALLAASFAFHAGWLMFASLLIYQSWTWKSSGLLLFDNKHFSFYILLILLAIAVMLFLMHFIPKVSNKTFGTLKPMKRFREGTYSRRAFLGGFIAVLIAGAAYYFGLLRTHRSAKSCAFESDSVLLKGYEQDFVGNRRTKILHHRVACQNHLPRNKNRSIGDVLPNLFCPHATYRSSILEQLAIRDSAKERYESAIAHLERAIKLSPFSYHLYDRLIGLYGRVRQYDKIDILLQEALQSVRGVKQPRSLRMQRSMQRAEREFKVRSQACNYRKTNSLERKQRAPVMSLGD
jgi:tetratricopeptide (TPR) repeat protein